MNVFVQTIQRYSFLHKKKNPEKQIDDTPLQWFFKGRTLKKIKKLKKVFAKKTNMDINWAALLFAIAILASIATIVLFIIACCSNTPFNMNSRSEGLLVAAVLALLTIFWSSAALYLSFNGRAGKLGVKLDI